MLGRAEEQERDDDDDDDSNIMVLNKDQNHEPTEFHSNMNIWKRFFYLSFLASKPDFHSPNLTADM